MIRAGLALAALLCAGVAGAQVDPRNPSCPLEPQWSTTAPMKFTPLKRDGKTILMAEGGVDDALLPRLTAALAKNKPIDEIWIRSPGGNAEIGNQAGLMIRKEGIPTRIPKGWACFSACNFVFMGGPIRAVDEGGLFIVHMFTFTSDGGVMVAQVQRSKYNEAVETIGEVEQGSALLASQDNDFLIRMGVSRKLLTEVMYRQKAVQGEGADKSTRRCLTQDEMMKYNVTNYR